MKLRFIQIIDMLVTYGIVHIQYEHEVFLLTCLHN